MVDVKVLAAVLVSLAAFGMISGGGEQTFKTPSNLIPGSFGSIDNVGPRSLGAFLGVIEEDTSREEISADFNYNNSDEQEIKFVSGEAEIEGLKEIGLKNGKINSQNSLKFHNTSGTTTFSPETTIEATSESIITNGVNITGPHSFKENLESPKTSLRGINSEEILLRNVEGEIKSGSTSSNLRESTDVDIKSFKGDLIIKPYEGELSLNGTVNKLDAGSVNIN